MGSGNSWGNDFFVVRWVGELYPRWPGVATYNLNTNDGGRIIIRRNPAYRLGEGEPTPFFQGFLRNEGDTFLNTTQDGDPENDAVGVEAWRDGDNRVSFRLELQCADPGRPSPYLVEIQAYENDGNAFVRLTTQGDGHPLENYDLRYLKPLQPVNKPCQPDPRVAPERPYQAHCQTCEPIWYPPCPTNICQPETIIQTARLPDGCPGQPPPPREVTCQPPRTCGAWSEWTPECTVANGGTRVTQTRSRNCTVCGTSYTETQSQTVDCRQTCNYDWGPWTPASCDEVIGQIDCGTTRTFTQTRRGTLIASTSSPTCEDTATETRPLRCQGRPCGSSTFAPETRSKSPLGEWMAAKPNTVELR
ncbi:type II secretion system protein, partial [Synechococcus sp. F70.1]